MGSPTMRTMFDEEHEAFVSVAQALTPEQWTLPSLCPEWTVRDVVEHIAFHIHAKLREFAPSGEKMTARMLGARARAVDRPPARRARVSHAAQISAQDQRV